MGKSVASDLNRKESDNTCEKKLRKHMGRCTDCGDMT